MLLSKHYGEHVSYRNMAQTKRQRFAPTAMARGNELFQNTRPLHPNIAQRHPHS